MGLAPRRRDDVRAEPQAELPILARGRQRVSGQSREALLERPADRVDVEPERGSW